MNLSLCLTRIEKISHVLRSPMLLRALLVHGVLAGAEHRGVLNPNLATVVDIGANRGQFSLAVRRWAPHANIFAFEPVRTPAAVFQKLFDDDPQVTFFQVAIGPHSGEAVMHVAAEDDSSSLLPISKKQQELFPGTSEVRTERVQVGRLSDFISVEDIRSPALLKLDVQGYELEALKGCEDLLDRFAWVYAECSFTELYRGQPLADELIAWLRVRGFLLRGVYTMAYDAQGRSIQGDFLFSRSEHMA